MEDREMQIEYLLEQMKLFDIPILLESHELLESEIHTSTPLCLDCARKHLARAAGYFEECQTGRYPSHFWRAVGELSLAEDHVRLKWNYLCKLIEDERLRVIAEDNYYPAMDNLLNFADTMAKKEVKDTDTENELMKFNENLLWLNSFITKKEFIKYRQKFPTVEVCLEEIKKNIKLILEDKWEGKIVEDNYIKRLREAKPDEIARIANISRDGIKDKQNES